MASGPWDCRRCEHLENCAAATEAVATPVAPKRLPSTGVAQDTRQQYPIVCQSTSLTYGNGAASHLSGKESQRVTSCRHRSMQQERREIQRNTPQISAGTPLPRPSAALWPEWFVLKTDTTHFKRCCAFLRCIDQSKCVVLNSPTDDRGRHRIAELPLSARGSGGRSSECRHEYRHSSAKAMTRRGAVCPVAFVM